MWYANRVTPNADPGYASSVAELFQATSRRLIVVIGVTYLCWQLVASASRPDIMEFHFLIVPVVFLAGILALYALRRNLVLAQAIWQTGLAIAITAAVYRFQQPANGFLYVLLPLMATITVGWPAGLCAEGVVAALVLWFSYGPCEPRPLAPYSLGIIGGGALLAAVGWVATDSLLTVTQWSLYGYERAREKMEEARDQRLELKQVQEDLLLANRELARLSDRLSGMHRIAEEARRAKEDFVANVSHELRTPLNMIIGFSEMITRSPEIYADRLPPSLLADIAAIQDNSQHLARLVDDVLDLSQIEAGRMALSREWGSLQQIVAKATHIVQALYDSKGLYLESEVAADLPPVLCDTTRIRQVVINLLSNAGRFTERGGVRLKAWRDRGEIVVSVADTGPGIAPEEQEKLFIPFHEVDGSIRRRHSGSGLGLSISRRFVEMHGGRVWLESPSARSGAGEGGPGTTFYFSLPLEGPPEADVAGADQVTRWLSPHGGLEYRTRSGPSRAPAPAVTPRFVILERGETLRRLFSRYVQGVEVIPVKGIEDALGELSRSPAQALIVNAPPFAEPLASADQLNSLPYGTPAVTCWVPGGAEVAQRLGVVHYLVKPVTREALLSALGSLGEGVRSLLLVDDDPGVLQLFSRMLEETQRSYRILQAKSGRRALDLLRQRRPDAMLLDLVMPGLDGFQVLREKSQDPAIRDVPVVVVSSRDPTGEPAMSDTFSVARSGGLPARDLVACIQAVSEILTPSTRPADRARSPDRGQPERPGA